MPIYEFRCSSCRRRTSVFTRSIGAPAGVVCEHCGSSDISRLMSRVAIHRSEGDSFDGFDESSLGDVDENDPRSMARWVRKMSRQMGEPLDADMEADLERMEAGEMPDDLDAGGDEDEFASVD
ncbi:MAG: zinc ribbon domain-containing protein [Chloroflexi bacterium]|nr:MAG: zinc ribbon domain-containing protein [Chloroflexota bacterium]